MKNTVPLQLCKWLMFLCLLLPFITVAQTSWKGTVSTAWSVSSNWTAGVPTAASDAIIGDANFIGPFSPVIDTRSRCRSLSITSGTLTVNRSLTVYGTLLISSGATLSQGKANLNVKGSWTNNGTYTTTNTGALVDFSGNTQTVGGTNTTTFSNLIIGAGSSTIVNLNTVVTTALTVNGTLIPIENATPVVISGAGTVTVNAGGEMQVKASTFAGNYSLSGTNTMNAGSTVSYNATLVNQTVSNTITYSTLRINGAGTKTLAGNLNPLNSSASTSGNIEVLAATLDLSSFTANRGTTTAGGYIQIANGATLKIGGTNTFPANYGAAVLPINSTVEYSGTTQTISALTYGNLTLSSGSGSAVKTLPATTFIIAGNLTLNQGGGTAVTATLAANTNVYGNTIINTNATLNGSSFGLNISGNLTNTGTLTGASGTISLIGDGSIISGTGTYNFNNLTIQGDGVTAAAATNMTVTGNLTTTQPGSFTHTAGTGTLTMTGSSKTISGTGINLNNLTISGTVSTSSLITISGNLAVNGSLSATGGVIDMTGTTKTISGGGTLSFGTLIIDGALTTAIGFSIGSALNVNGTLSASAGTITFTGSSILSGNANLFNVVLNGTSLQLAAGSNLGIAGTYTLTAGALNTASTIPNTVTFNGTGAQSIAANSFNNLTIAGSNTKTISGAVTVNGDLTIASGATLSGGSQTLTVLGNWANGGTFTPSTSTVVMSGAANATITGATTFNILTINKTSSTNQVTMLANAGAATVNMTNGSIITGVNTFTISNTRTGNGIILGNITRTNGFAIGTSYAFESPNTTITFTGLFLGSSVTISSLPGQVSDFPSGGAINREYDVSSVGLSIQIAVTLRLHYEDAILNGNTKTALDVYRYNGTSWANLSNSGSSTTLNYVELTGLLSTGTGRYTLASPLNVVRWNGSVSSDWNTAANWTVATGSPARPPGTGDIAEIGTIAFTNQPTISTAANVRGVYFGSTQVATLTLASGGSLTTQGNIAGSWSANAIHTINTNSQNLTVNGSLLLGDGVAGHGIQLNIGSGTTTVLNDIVQNGSGGIAFNGAGQLNIGGNFNYAAGTFTPGSGTVVYNGSGSQNVGGVNYNNLTFNNTGIAQIGSSTIVNGTLTAGSGVVTVNAATTVSGGVQINSGATVNGGNTILSVGGNWSNSGTFNPGASTVNINGSGAQNITASTFNNLTVNKTAGIASVSGNATINGNLSVTGGTLDLTTATANRSIAGGTFSVGSGATLSVGGAGNFPSNYAAYTLNSSSIVNYYATAAQNINGGITYGTLQLNGGTKTLTGNISVNGDLQTNTGATLSLGTFTADVTGNWTNNGSLTPGTGTITLRGTGKTLSGNNTFNRLSIFGYYTASGTNTYNGLLQILTGAGFDNGNGATIIAGDFYNNGTYTGSGAITFPGIILQTLRLANAFNYNAAGTINFNGTVTPLILLGTTPVFPSVNIANTGGINPGGGWTVQGTFNVGTGAVFNGGLLTHQFTGAVTNSGTINSGGTLNLAPSASQTVQLNGVNSSGTLLFGGSGALNLIGTPALITNVVVANPVGVSPGTGWTMNGNLQTYAGSSFNAGANTFIVNGNLESNGKLNGGTSTFTMGSSNGYLAGGDSTIFYNIVFNGNIAAIADFCVSNNLTINGSLDASLGIAVMTGSSTGNITGTASPFNLAQLEVSKSSGITALLTRSLTKVTNLDVLSGIMDTQDTTAILQDVTLGGTLVIKNNARLIIRGTFSLPTFNAYRLDTLSTVEYAGTTQTVSAATPYGNLVISTAGNKTAPAALHMLHDFTLSNGNFIQGTFTDTLEGSWTMSSGAYTNTNATVLFSGKTDQQVSSTGSFNNITVNKTLGQVVLNTNITTNGVLNFTLGNIRTGSNTTIIAATGSVTGAAQNTGWVYGFLQKSVSTGTNVSRIFEVGDSLRYTPVSVLFANVSTAGTVTANTVSLAHPLLASSGINTSRKVNRYWKLTNTGIVFTTVAVTLNWVTADVDAGATPANFKVAEFAGGVWTLPTTVSPQPLSIQETGTSVLGDFVAGELAVSNVWTGAVNTNWFVTGNWSAGLVPVATTNVIIPSALTNYPLITTGIALANDLGIQTGASVTVNGGSLQIGGALSNAGTLNAQNGTMIFAGILAQTIPASTFVNNTVLNLTTTNSVTLTIGGTLNISGILKASAGQLITGNFVTLLSTASQTALIDGSESGQITGNVTVQRYLASSFGYRYLSSPFQSATVNQFADEVNLSASFPSFYSYDETKASAGWTNYMVATNPLVPLQGYAAQLGTNTTPITLSATGIVNNQTVTAPVLTNTNQPYTLGFNLIGNPYPSPVDWDATTGWSRTNVDNAVYYFNPGGADQYTGTYSSYINGVSSDGVANNIIPAMQGFFIHVTDGAYPVTGSLVLNNAARVNNLNPSFHRIPQNTALLRISASFADDGLAPDPLVVYFDAEATNAFEKTLDALKMNNTDNTVPSCYTWSDDHQRLSINAWPEYPDSNTVIPVGIQTENSGYVTFNTLTLQRMPAQMTIYLKDAVAGHYQQITENAKYRVYLEAGKYDQRFSLVFKRPAIENEEASNFRAFSVKGTLYGFFEKVPDDKCRITVSNILGQILWQRDYKGSGTQTLGDGYASGVYIVTFTAEGKRVSRKVFISN